MSLKISSDFISNLVGSSSTRQSRQIDRLEQRRERLDKSFDAMQKDALDSGDTTKAQKIFEVSEVLEDKLDSRLDKLESKYGVSSSSQSRQIDNAFDDLRSYAYSQEEGDELVKKVFDLSQLVKGYSSGSSGSSGSQDQALLKQLLSDSLGTKSSTSTSTDTSTSAGTSTSTNTSTGTSTST